MNTTEISVKMTLDRWRDSILACNKHLDLISDEQLENEVSPGKNRGIYILGHLIAVHDAMLVLLDLGEKVYPALFEPFIKNADKNSENIPSAAELRALWHQQNAYLQDKFDALKTEDWFAKHTAVSEEDFAREPHRNKLNIIITRTSHLQYHMGQIALLKR